MVVVQQRRVGKKITLNISNWVLNVMKPKLITVVGPTASGKSDIAVALAARFSGEVVSADSRQVYRGMDLGTGKITPEEMQGIPHHLLDVASPRRQFSVARFTRLADAAIAGIIRRGRVPILCGGTGWYVAAVVDGLVTPAVPPNNALRAALRQRTPDELLAQLTALDPARAATIERRHPRRLIRAIEIATALGSVPPLTATSPYTPLMLGIHTDDTPLKARIHTRLRTRLKQGMLEEVVTLRESGLSWERLDNFGLEYRFLSRHVRGLLTYDEMCEKLEHAIWQYAKRQRTWFKRDHRIQWFTLEEQNRLFDLVDHFLSKT